MAGAHTIQKLDGPVLLVEHGVGQADREVPLFKNADKGESCLQAHPRLVDLNASRWQICG